MSVQSDLFEDLPLEDQQAIHRQLSPTLAWQRGDSTVWFAWCCGALVYTPQRTKKPTGDCPSAGCDPKYKPTRWMKVTRPYGPFRADTGEEL